eukprot:scaffold7210_cov32-Tisochrysis_lutea.AAC.9
MALRDPCAWSRATTAWPYSFTGNCSACTHAVPFQRAIMKNSTCYPHRPPAQPRAHLCRGQMKHDAQTIDHALDLTDHRMRSIAAAESKQRRDGRASEY